MDAGTGLLLRRHRYHVELTFLDVLESSLLAQPEANLSTKDSALASRSGNRFVAIAHA